MRHDAGATSLQLEQDYAGQRAEWRFERAGWATVAVLIAAGLSGLFGDGPFARATAVSANNSATLHYDRIAHLGSASRLSLTLPAAAPDDTLAVVTISQAYLDAVDVTRITPEPVDTRASSEMVSYRIRRAPAGQSTQVDFSTMPGSPWMQHAFIGTPSGAIAIRQLVLP